MSLNMFGGVTPPGIGKDSSPGNGNRSGLNGAAKLAFSALSGNGQKQDGSSISANPIDIPVITSTKMDIPADTPINNETSQYLLNYFGIDINADSAKAPDSIAALKAFALGQKGLTIAELAEHLEACNSALEGTGGMISGGNKFLEALFQEGTNALINTAIFENGMKDIEYTAKVEGHLDVFQLVKHYYSQRYFVDVDSSLFKDAFAAATEGMTLFDPQSILAPNILQSLKGDEGASAQMKLAKLFRALRACQDENRKKDLLADYLFVNYINGSQDSSGNNHHFILKKAYDLDDSGLAPYSDKIQEDLTDIYSHILTKGADGQFADKTETLANFIKEKTGPGAQIAKAAKATGQTIFSAGRSAKNGATTAARYVKKGSIAASGYVQSGAQSAWQKMQGTSGKISQML